MKLNFTKQDIAHAIEYKLNAKPKTNSEKNVWYILEGRKILRVTYPHGKGFIPLGTVKSIVNQLRLNNSQFKDFVNCPLTAQQYEEIIRALELL